MSCQEKPTLNQRGCWNLVDAIFKQAAKDYRKSNGKDLNARDFFLHDRLIYTLNVDGALILERLDKELERKKKSRGKEARKPQRTQKLEETLAVMPQADGQFILCDCISIITGGI